MISLKVLWRNLFHRSDAENELSDELKSYADLLTEDKLRNGLSNDAARREALLEIGGMEQVKEQVRDVRHGSFLESMAKDIQQSLRSLRHSAGLTILAVCTLGLGLGATTLIFSVFYAVLLQPLPFRNPEQLVQLWETRVHGGWGQSAFSRPNFWDLRAENKAFESVGALLGSDMNLTGHGDPQHLSVGLVSAEFFHVLGVTPVIGHDFEKNQDQPGQDGVVLVSNQFWKSHFASSPEMLGKNLRLDGRNFTVIGALPKGEPWLNAADVFVPMVYEQSLARGNFELSVIGRLAPGMTIAAANADLQRISADLSSKYKEDQGFGVRMAPSDAWGARPAVQRALWVLLAAVGFLLLIACVNIANLLLAKGSSRSRELRLREALGASRWRIVRLLLTESLILGCTGAALGLMLASFGLQVIRSADLTGIPNLSEIGINGWVLAFTLLATLFSVLASGIMPALRASSGDLAVALREGDRSQTASRAQNLMRAVLVTAEVALSVMLLIGAGLLIRSFNNVLHVDRGFQTTNRVIAAVDIPLSYNDDQAANITRELIDRTSALPGVEAVGVVNSRPIVGWDPGMGFGAIDSAHNASADVPWSSWRVVSAGYFKAMGIRLVRGRLFSPLDFYSKPRHVIISDSVAQNLWPNQDPIGRQIILWKGQSNKIAEVVGVVGSIRDHGLTVDPTRTVYIANIGQWASPVQFIIRGTSTPGAVASSLRTILAGIDPTIPVSEVQTMDDLVGNSLGAMQLNTVLLAGFALIALVLSATGIYGVLSYSVARRTAEIGVRVALGANRNAIFRLIIIQGMQPIVAGLVIGIAGSLMLTQFISSLLFEVASLDAASYLTVTLLIAVTALMACWLPARRALFVDPVTALREA